MKLIESSKGALESLGGRIRRARLAKFLSLEQLADDLGVSKVTVWNWENDRTRPRLARIAQLSDLLGLPVHVLMGDNDSEERSVTDLIYHCQCQIAQLMGVQPESVEIKVKFSGHP